MSRLPPAEQTSPPGQTSPPPVLMPSPTAALHGGSAPAVRSAPQRPGVPGCMSLDSDVILSFVRPAALCPGARWQKNKDSPLLLISGSGCTPSPPALSPAAELSQSDEIPSPQRAGSEGCSDPTDPERGQSAGQQLPSSRDFGKCQQALRYCSLAPAPAAGLRVNTCSVSQINGGGRVRANSGGGRGASQGLCLGRRQQRGRGADGAPAGFSSAGGTGPAAGKRSRLSKVKQWECALHPLPTEVGRSKALIRLLP